MSDKYQQTSFRLPVDLHEKLKMALVKDKVSLSKKMNELVEEYVESHE